MAPKKRSDKQQDPAKPELQARVTRSSAKRAANAGPAESEPELLKKKKTKKAAKKEEEHEEKNSAPNTKTVVLEQPEPELPKRKAKKVEKKEEELGEVNSDTTAKTIVIEHCKQCNSFKTRAIQVKEGLEKSVAGITVLVNPDKAWKLWRDGTSLDLVNPTLGDSYSRDEVIKCLHIGLLSIQNDPVDRPTIESIVLMLNSYLVPLPSPKEPAYLFRSVGEQNMQSNETESDQFRSKLLPMSVDEAS